MLDDILGQLAESDNDEKVLEKIPHEGWCMLRCLAILMSLTDVGIMQGGGTVLTEKGMDVVNLYWKDKEPTEEDISIGMSLCQQCGII